MSEPKEYPDSTEVENSTELEIKSEIKAGDGFPGLRDGYPDSDTGSGGG